MVNWETVSSLATGLGTLVLAIATFSAVHSANRAARVAEQALLVGVRPLLVPSRLDDTSQKIFYGDQKFQVLLGGRGAAEVEGGIVYLALSVRNAGRGIGVLHGWRFRPGRQTIDGHPSPDDFHPQQRDLLIPPGDIGFWQGAFRDPADPQYENAVAAVQAGDLLTIDVLYGDHEGGQRAISRFVLQPMQRHSDAPGAGDGQGQGDAQQRVWLASVVRHWNIDRPDPR
jgi:hypothetical protein